jgi:hypothetical protein
LDGVSWIVAPRHAATVRTLMTRGEYIAVAIVLIVLIGLVILRGLL